MALVTKEPTNKVLNSYKFDDYAQSTLPQFVRVSTSVLTLYVFGETPDVYGDGQVFLEIWLWGPGSKFLPAGNFELEIDSSEILRPVAAFIADKVFLSTGSVMLRGWCAVTIGRLLDQWRWKATISYNSQDDAIQIYGVTRTRTVVYRQWQVPVTSIETRDEPDSEDEPSNADHSTRVSPIPATLESTRDDWLILGD